MAASSGSVAGSGNQPSSLGSLGHITDEREFNRFASVVPDSEATHSFPAVNLSSKKFSATREEVSESVLSEGFSWSAIKPPRPGQYSQRHHPPSPVTGPSCNITQPSNLTRDIPPSPWAQINVSPAHRPSAPQPPLDLPELGLLGTHTSGESPHGEHPVVPGCMDKPESALQDGSCEITSLQQFPKPSSRSPVSTLGKSGSQDETGTLQAGPDPIRYQLPFMENSTEPKASTLSRSSKVVELIRCPLQLSQTDSELPHTTLRPPSQSIPVQHLDNFKLSLSRGARNDVPHQADPPSSVCGDLERPAPRTPRSSRRTTGQDRYRMQSRPVVSPRQHEKRDHHHDRSHSRASNISRKRSTIRKRRARSDPERKKEAMHHVAQYWNECIRISEDEKIQANLEIEQLQNELALQEEKLAKTIDVVKEKDSQVNNVQIRCAELEDQNRHAVTENQCLSDEIKTLKDQLQESRKHVSELKDKHRTYRSKLNETIVEQQALYNRSCQIHEETKQELQNERDRRIAESKAVEDAIQTSSKKHKELKSCLQKFREETDRESRRRDEITTKLNAKLKQQETELSHEREAAAELRHRIDEQEKIEGKMEKVEFQIQSLIDSIAKWHAKEEDQKEYTSRLSSQLELIIEHLTTPNAPTSADIKNLAETLEQRIVSRILPAVLTIISGQTQAEEAAMTCKKDLHDKLEQTQRELMQKNQRQHQNQEDDEASHSKLRDLLSRLDAQSIHIEKTHEQTIQQMLDWTQSQDSRLKDMETTLRGEIVQQLKSRESVTPLEEKVQLLAEDYTNRVEVMKDLILQSDEEAKRHLQDTVEAIRNTLSKGFNETRDRSEQARSTSETAHAALETCLKELKEKLEEGSHNNHEHEELRQALGKEKSKNLDLRQQLTRLEHETGSSKDLHEKWRTVVKSIDVLKAQLKDTSERLPQLETIEANFQNMLQVNQMLNSTTAYLMSENTWVNQHLKDNPKLEVQDTNVEKPQSSQHVTIVKEEPTSDLQPKNADLWSRSMDSWDQTAGITSQEEAVRRKVVVYSPRSDTTSPSPPPSIGQEQRRRREAAVPRSIMRLSGPGQDSTQEPQQSRITPNHSQYNRPVTSKVGPAVTNGKQDMIDQIRSSLVQPKAAEKSWGLPTVADFERQAHPSHCHTQVTKKHTINSTEKNEGLDAKRVRSDDGSLQTAPELKNQRQLSPRKRLRVLQTYSCKSTDIEVI